MTALLVGTVLSIQYDTKKKPTPHSNAGLFNKYSTFWVGHSGKLNRFCALANYYYHHPYYTCTHTHTHTHTHRGAQIPGARSPWRLNFVQWLLIFGGGGGFKMELACTLMAPRILRWPLHLYKLCATLHTHTQEVLGVNCHTSRERSICEMTSL